MRRTRQPGSDRITPYCDYSENERCGDTGGLNDDPYPELLVRRHFVLGRLRSCGQHHARSDETDDQYRPR